MMQRRQFLGTSAALLSSMGLYATPKWLPLQQRRKQTETRGTARNLIFISLAGGPSHVDTFDLKVNATTPDLLGVETFSGGFQWPSGIFPQLSKMTDQFSLVRSLSGVEAVHERASYHMLAAHRPNSALSAEIPYLDAMLSYQMEAARRETDSLPTLITSPIESFSGFLASKHKGMSLGYSGQIENLEHYYDRADQRRAMFQNLLNAAGTPSDHRNDHRQILSQAQKLMDDPELLELFSDDGGVEFFDGFARDCRQAVKILASKKGCRVIRLEHYEWDHHFDIYSPESGLPFMAMSLDNGLSYLIKELQKLPGQTAGKSLFDETLIVACGEFARTPGEVEEGGGRDHFPDVNSAFFAGGGIKGGRQIGATNTTGAYITDLGWSHFRHMGFPDLAATIYSALGIDYLQQFQDTPSGRVFEMVETGLTGDAHEIDQLFV